MDFMNEEEIVSADKKYQAIFEYLLSDEKTPKYPSKRFTFPKDKIKDKKNFRDIVWKDNRYKTEVIIIDGKDHISLMRNWNYSNAIKNEVVLKKSDNWMIYSRVYEVNDICFKAHWGSGSHLSIERTIEAIKGLGYRWDKMEKDARELFYRWEVCGGKTKTN